MAGLLNIIPKVQAQTSDASSQPTFGPIELNGGSSTSSTILLKSDKTAVKVGERFKVTIEIRTNNITINEYRIIVDFDPTKLQVIDQDTQTQGTQAKLLDTIFLIATPAQDNVVNSIGRARIVAKTPTGNAFQVNRDVIELEFQAQAVGATNVKVFQGTEGSQLIRSTGVGLSYSPNEVTIQVGTESGQTTTGTTGGTTTNTNTGGTTSVTPPPGTGVIPDTAIEDDISLIGSVAIGLSMVVLGFNLFYEKLRNKK